MLTPDFLGVEEEALRTVLAARPEVFNHNIETVRRLHRRMRGAKASYDKALWLLARAKELADYPVLTKSGIIVGLGETNEEVVETMRDLREHGVDVVTIGQYLQPSSKHTQIDRWVHPDEFRWFREQGEELGLRLGLLRPSRALVLPGGRAAPRGRDGPRRRRLLTEAGLGAELPVLEADLVRAARSGDAVVPALEGDALDRRVGLRRRLAGEATEAVRREIGVDLVELGRRKLRRALRRR